MANLWYSHLFQKRKFLLLSFVSLPHDNCKGVFDNKGEEPKEVDSLILALWSSQDVLALQLNNFCVLAFLDR